MRVATIAFVPHVEVDMVVVVNLTTTSAWSHQNVGDLLGVCTERHRRVRTLIFLFEELNSAPV
jgi:hypothetical protein